MDTTGNPSLTIIALQRIGTDPMGQVIATISAESESTACAIHEGRHIARPYATRRDGDVVRVTCLDADLARVTVLGAARLGTLLHIGPTIIPDLLMADGSNVMTITTHAPVQFRSGRQYGNDNGSRLDALFPDPDRIVKDALSKWEAAGWPPLTAPNTNRIGGRIERYRVTPYRSGRHVWQGWSGAVTLDLRPLSPEDRQTVWRIMRFASLRGLGSHTTYGMGAVDVGSR